VFGAGLAVRAVPPGTWPKPVRLWGDDTARRGAVLGWVRLGVVVGGASWSREGAVRSFGFRRVPVPAAAARPSRDGEVRIEFVLGTGSLDACTGILDGRGMPLGLFWRVSSMLNCCSLQLFG
jgi:hypothetical protein